MASDDIKFVDYENEKHLTEIQSLVSADLSEPYSIFTYRFFLHNWPKLCVCAFSTGENEKMIGTIVCKAEVEQGVLKGYIAMLTVNNQYRKKGIGSQLAVIGMKRMIEAGCKEIVLETEVSNVGAISLYEKMGFIKEERLARYYLNGGDAFRLRLWVEQSDEVRDAVSSDNITLEEKVDDTTTSMSNMSVSSEAAKETTS
mmetsp:Transcript_12306/g.18645  ORF Transcript_12306/g.18645 Transcript_12306/m.18645 type:complete len:200 (+) Transcript_12306:94-693(+)